MSEDRLSLKNILFTKAMPNIVIPFPTVGYKIFPCIDCGDKFIFQSSYQDHVNRRSLKITYMCRHCGQKMCFFNRCNLLSHIRSHAFKTATINVSDLIIEPLPLSPSANLETMTEKTIDKPSYKQNKQNNLKLTCFECKMDITFSGVVYKDRAKHYMQCTTKNIVCYTCPVCLFSLPTSCGLIAHLRIHLQQMPIICPECGMNLKNNIFKYPYSHGCDGFNMIRATTRIKCSDEKCEIFHPSEYREHMTNHVRKVYKCPICSFKWYDVPPETKHTLCNNRNVNIVCYYMCPLCTKTKLFTKNQINKHLINHFNSSIGNELKAQVYPCRACGEIYKDVNLLLQHQLESHETYKDIIESIIKTAPKSKGIYKVIKRCEKCQRSFTYRCQFENIQLLPTECPYNCALNAKDNEMIENTKIICFMCKSKIDINWENIKKHFAKFHNTINCVDVKVNLSKINLKAQMERKKKIIRKSRKTKNTANKKQNAIRDIFTATNKDKSNNYCDANVSNSDQNIETSCTTVLTTVPEQDFMDKKICNICKVGFETKEMLEIHIVEHKDPCTAYQCLECGQCFVVKPSFAKHLLLEHGIADVQEYIDKKNCFNELAFSKTQKRSEEFEGPVEENQCRICREKFQDPVILEKHFRVHGMAFLMKQAEKS